MAPDVSKLQKSSAVLRLIHYRNKNQHRVTTWFQRLSMLKRCVDKLIRELEESSFRHPWHMRVRHMNRYTIPQCYDSFSQVVADNQFATLGLVLVAELARIRDAIKSEGFSSDSPGSSTVRTKVKPPSKEDVGEVVVRTTPDAETAQAVDPSEEAPDTQWEVTDADTPGMPVDIAGTLTRRAYRPKKKKKANAIDELFMVLD